MANKRIQDLEQTTDLTNDDLIPLDTTKKTFATTLKSLVEWLKGTFQTTANLEQTLSEATDKYPSSKVLKDESSRIVSIMNNQYSNLLSTLYPVGSIYIGTQNSCPLAPLIAGSQWQKVATQVIIDVDNNVWIAGNGKGLGLTSGNQTFCLTNGAYGGASGFMQGEQTSYNKNVGTQRGGNFVAGDGRVVGVVSDVYSSGLYGSVGHTAIDLNVWKRTA